MLGWNIYKLWSPDWWDNPQKIVQEILKAIEEAQKTVVNSQKKYQKLGQKKNT